MDPQFINMTLRTTTIILTITISHPKIGIQERILRGEEWWAIRGGVITYHTFVRND